MSEFRKIADLRFNPPIAAHDCNGIGKGGFSPLLQWTSLGRLVHERHVGERSVPGVEVRVYFNIAHSVTIMRRSAS
jgi:hypothetical protein